VRRTVGAFTARGLAHALFLAMEAGPTEVIVGPR
jgi:hypothetical protein